MVDPLVGKYYLGGFARLTPEMTRFSLVAVICSRPTEALGVVVLEDDMAARQIEAYEVILEDELRWMANLDEAVWQLLSLSSFSDSSCRAIMTDCMDCAHISCGYTHTNFLSKVRSLPWSLAIGDVEANLKAFAKTTDELSDPVAKKIRRLLMMKYNLAELTEAVSMLKECRWSTAFAEQLHAHAAVLHKLHREYGPFRLQE